MTDVASRPPSRVMFGLEPGLSTWLAAIVFMLVCLALRDRMPWLVTYPANWTLPIASAINILADWTVGLIQPLFRTLSAVLGGPMTVTPRGLSLLPLPARR